MDLRTLLDLVLAHVTLQDLNVSLALHLVLAKQVLDYLPSSIRKVQLHVHQIHRLLGTEIRVSDWPSQNDGKVRKATSSHPNLESLTLSGYFKTMAEHTLLGFLSTCTSNFKSFSRPETNCFESRSLAAAPNKIGLFPEVFERYLLPHRQKSADSEIASTISRHPHLCWINLEDCRGSGPLTAEAIVDCGHNPGLRPSFWLRRVDEQELGVDSVQVNNLREFMAIFFFDYSSRKMDPVIRAEDLIASEWKTPSFKYLYCQIKVPRRDQDVEAHAVDDTFGHFSSEHSCAIQRQALGQIGQKTNLANLSFN
jgi:hypothetical protein